MRRVRSELQRCWEDGLDVMYDNHSSATRQRGHISHRNCTMSGAYVSESLCTFEGLIEH